MEYSIQELSRLSGVTTRALRWYDQIGLLKPSRVAESGYRYYGPAEVDRLQDILYYRALQSHLAALEAERTRLDALIQSVRDTIRCEERKEIMSDEQKFEALKQRVLTRYEQIYGKEARDKYGDDMVGAAQSALRDLTVEQYREWTELGQKIQEHLEAAIRAGLSPESEAGQEVAALHRRWLTVTGNPYDPAKHRGIAALYVQDPRFTAYYDKAVPGCARFLCEAVACWVK